MEKSQGRILLGLLAVSYTVSFIDRALVAVAAGPIKHDLGLSDSQFGFLTGTAFALFYCLCGIPLGWLADRFDRRAIIAAGLAFWSLMTALCGLSDSFPAFVLARIGVGLGEACLIPAAMSLLGNVIPGERMARAVAVFLIGATGGNAIALLCGGWLLTHLGEDHLAPWRQLFLLACPPGLLLAGLIMLVREPERRDQASFSRKDVTIALRYLAGRGKAYGFLTAATACCLTLAQTQGAWIPLYFTRHFGLAAGRSAMTVGILFLLSAPTGQWVGGQMIDRLRAWGVMGPANMMQAICCLSCLPAAAIFCTTDGFALACVTYGIFNFLVFAATPAGMAGWQMLALAKCQGLLTSVLVALVTLVGIGVGPLVVGLLTDNLFVDESALGLSLFSVMLIAGLAGGVLALMGRKPFAEAIARAPIDIPGVKAEPTRL